MDYTGLYNRSENLKYKQTPFNGGGQKELGGQKYACWCNEAPANDGHKYFCGNFRTNRGCERCCTKEGYSNAQWSGGSFNLPIYTQR